MRRITPEEVIAAVEKTGLELLTKKTCKRIDGKPCSGCVIYVLAVAEGFSPMPGPDSVWDAARFLGLEGYYAGGLMCGFDTGRPVPDTRPDISRSLAEWRILDRLGHADGLAIRNATIDNGCLSL